MANTDREGYVPISHPELGLESRVMPESLQTWLASGWQTVDDVSEETTAEPPAQDTDAPDEVEVHAGDEVVAEPEETQ